MTKWAVVVSEERFSQERLYASRFVPGAELPAGDEALLVAALEEPVVFGVARADGAGRLQYTVNLIDAPLPFTGKAGPLEPGAHRIDDAAFGAVSGTGEAPAKKTWLVSVDLPIEASSPAEAVREFWAYVRDLGPAELPAFVWPVGDELAMQAFVLGAEANQDPEEE